MLSKCKTCGSPLVDGPDAERYAGNDSFACTLKGIPTRVCSRGCPGAYWYWLDFGVEALETLDPDSPNIAKRKASLSRTRHFCRHCNVELTDKHESARFTFHKKTNKGTEMEVILEAPCLECTQCGSKYLASQSSSVDSYYSKLADVISEATTREFIWR